MAIRKCRDCGDVLPITRYFNCLSCRAVLPQHENEDVVYIGSMNSLSDLEEYEITSDEIEYFGDITHEEF